MQSMHPSVEVAHTLQLRLALASTTEAGLFSLMYASNFLGGFPHTRIEVRLPSPMHCRATHSVYSGLWIKKSKPITDTTVYTKTDTPAAASSMRV